jgi:Secretion system C-terminal sorting domain
MKKLLLISLLLTAMGAISPTEKVKATPPAVIVQLYLDVDGDTYWGKRNSAELGSLKYNNLIAKGYVPFPDQNANFALTKDCNDADNTVWRTVRLYVDVDGDGYIIDDPTNGTRRCIGNTVPDNYVIFEEIKGAYDCDDSDPSVWRRVQIFVDGDGDKWATGQGIPSCIGASAPAGYITVFEVEGYNDCDPSDGTTWQNVGLLFDNDGDNQVVFGTPLTFFCIGNTLPAKYILPENRKGINDCNDNDPTVWRNVCAKPIGRPGLLNTRLCIGATWPAGYTQCTPPAPEAEIITVAFSVYPNPATDRVYLMPEQDLKDRVEVKLMDAYGRVIRMVSAPNAVKGQNLSINTGDLKPGLYRVAIQSGETIVSKTIAVKL